MPSKLEQAIAAIKAGDKATGRQLLTEFLEVEPANERAWLWLTQTTDSAEERKEYLEKILDLNAGNEAARRGLGRLQKMQAGDTLPSVPEVAEVKPPPNQVGLALLILVGFGGPGCIVLGIAAYLLSYALDYDLRSMIW